MEITLVKAVNSDEVHGTDNDKKTGCGINLLKPENVTRYRRIGVMNDIDDLKEITCEKCKNILAKKIIKADKKERTRLIKEEKVRAKKGIEDENIVPLGNTVAKITRSPEELRAEENRKREEKAAAERRAAERRAAEEKAAAEKKSAEEKIAAEEAARAAAAPKTIPGTGIAIDSDLAAFAINVPKEEEKTPASNVQDDFLAQFAIEKPQEEADEEKVPVSNVQDDFLAQFAVPSPEQKEAVVNTPVNEYAPVQSNEYYPQQQVAEEPVAAVEEPTEEDDIMKMFSIGGDASKGMEVLSGTEPVESSIYDNDDAVIDVQENEIAEDTTYYEEAVAEFEEPQEEDIVNNSEWEYVANQLFGFAGVEIPDISAEEPKGNAVEETVAEAPVSEPVIEDIAMPEPVASEPVIEDIAMPEPVASEPVIEDIAMPEPIASEPVIEDIAMPEPIASEPAIENIAMPEPIAPAPVVEELKIPEPIAETPVVNENNSFGDGYVKKTKYSTPIFADEKAVETPAPAPIPAPVSAQPMAAPVQPQMTAPEQTSVITVPQFAGYDMNGQPIYNYVQMQMTGYDMNGQPIFAPIQPMAAPVQPAPTVQPMAAPVQPNSPYRVPTANISKIATHQHSKPIPKSFVNALANSREQGKKNLIETQGMNQMPVLNSVEDVLTQMGDEVTIKRQKENQNVPVFAEYKATANNNTVKSVAKKEEPERMLTKAELKAKKKQDKIDAKFKKDLAKRGF